ncbi:hypothetical protein AR438_13150 [Chryseobacterium aquaticum]|uniref:Restriction endonuclease type IV Mrr domain-containing protein n=1 Tax=Chryseobacterium aquaticum TaxID=452084 RepID=A0A0Q3K5N1_9FLAO|nr:restriction endonuclease [Chryseobacterium aquaticum]KQK25075.1 hypothetical protein AR438_13150 [Chryseobacterium aquaticum]
MNKNIIHDIVNQIISYDWSGFEKIDVLLIDVLSAKYTGDYLYELMDKFADVNTIHFRKLIKAIISINKDNIFIKINLEERLDGYYLQKKNSDINISKKYEEVISIINNIEQKGKRKGVLFEKFCQNFLIDLGISAINTRVSNDKGIDILGSYPINLPDNIGKLVFNDEIYLLVQTKYFNKKIDTPVIRKLVGDSLFIRFDELEYIDIKHNAFHLIVFSHNGFTEPAIEFAKRNKIMTFDSIQLAHIISEDPNKDWSCLKIFS